MPEGEVDERRQVSAGVSAPLGDDRPRVDFGNLARTRAYLERLPGGVDAYPRCLGKAMIHRHIQGSSRVRVEGLPSCLQAHLDHPVHSKWIPQAHSLALIVALVEAQGFAAHGAEESAWVRRAAVALFASPMYALLMRAVSPRLMIKGANLRWSAFFRGSMLHSEVRSDEADLYLEAPIGLFDPPLALIFTEVIRGALELAESHDEPMSLEFVDQSPGRVHYRCRW